MMKNKLSLFLIVVLWLIVSLPIASGAGQKRKKQTKPPVTNEESLNLNIPYSLPPFDPLVDKLPMYFWGNDIMALVKRLEKIPMEKDEFETTAQYSNRIKSAIGDDPYAFEPLGYSEKIRFDADQQVLKLEIPTDTLPASEFYTSEIHISDKLTTIPVAVDMGRGSYTGVSEQLKIKKKVISTVYKRYSVVLNQSSHPIQINVSMTSEYARENKPNIRVLLICRPSSSLSNRHLVVSQIQQFKRPTLASPVDTMLLEKYLNALLQEIWVYNIITGEILKREVMEDPPFRFIEIDDGFAVCLMKGIVKELRVRRGEVIQDIWRIDSINPIFLEVSNLRSGIHHLIGRSLVSPLGNKDKRISANVGIYAH